MCAPQRPKQVVKRSKVISHRQFKPYEKTQIQTSCTVEPIRLISDTDQNRVWQVHVSLDHPWSGLGSVTSQDVYVEVADVSGKWLMNRILFEQEVQRLVTHTH